MTLSPIPVGRAGRRCGLGLAAVLLCLLGCSPAGTPPVDVGKNSGGGGSGGGSSGDRGSGGTGVTEPPPYPPWVLGRYLENARDLGGVVAGDAEQVAYGVLFRGPPLRLSDAGCVEFADLRIRTVIDLRIDSERTWPPACVTDRARLVLAPLPVPYNVSPSDYIAIIDAGASIATAFAALGDAAAYPVYAHCTWGRDRTGVVFGLILLALGVSREAILQEYLLSDDTVGAYPASLVAALDEVERRGGIGPYLAGIGVTEAQVTALRERVLEPRPGP